MPRPITVAVFHCIRVVFWKDSKKLSMLLYQGMIIEEEPVKFQSENVTRDLELGLTISLHTKCIYLYIAPVERVTVAMLRLNVNTPSLVLNTCSQLDSQC